LKDGDEVRDLNLGVSGVQNPFDPTNPDATGDNMVGWADGILDGWNDWDNDGMINAHEFWFGTNPRNPNSWLEVPVLAVLALFALIAAMLVLGWLNVPCQKLRRSSFP
jgi:hypothetical protein